MVVLDKTKCGVRGEMSDHIVVILILQRQAHSQTRHSVNICIIYSSIRNEMRGGIIKWPDMEKIAKNIARARAQL